MRSAAAGMLSFLVACHATEPLPTPDVSGAASALFIGERDGAVLFASAYDVDEQGRIDILAPSSRAGDRWWFLSMGCPLATIGLESGTVVLADTAAAQVPVPPPLSIQAMSPSVAGAWTVEETTPDVVRDALLRLPVSEELACTLVEPAFETEAHEFQLEIGNVLYAPSFGAKLDDRTYFATYIESDDFTFSSTTGHSAYYLDFETEEATRVPFDLPPILAGHVDDGGEMWLLAPDSLLRGTPSAGFTVTATLGDVGRVLRGVVAGRGAGDDVELSITTSKYDGLEQNVERHWLHYASGRLDTLVRDERGLILPSSVVVGDGHIFAINVVTNPEPLIHELCDGTITTAPTPKGSRLVEIIEVPGVGVVGRNSALETYRYVDGSFELFQEFVPFITTMFTTDTGLMFAGAGIRPKSARPGDSLGAHQLLDWPGGCSYSAVPPGGTSTSFQNLDGGRSLLTFDALFDPGKTRATLVTLTGGPEPCTQR